MQNGFTILRVGLFDVADQLGRLLTPQLGVLHDSFQGARQLLNSQLELLLFEAQSLILCFLGSFWRWAGFDHSIPTGWGISRLLLTRHHQSPIESN